MNGLKFNFIKSRYGFLPFVGVMLFFIVIIFFIAEGEKREILHERNLQDTQREAEILSLIIRDALTKGDYVAVENFISSWGAKRKDIIKVKVVSKNNFIIGDYTAEHTAIVPHNVKVKLNYGDNKQATLSLIVDSAHLYKLFNSATLKLFVSIFFIFLVLGFALWHVLEVTAFRPLINEIKLRKQYEDQLVEAKDLAETANNAKSEFLSRMSHEFRTPLNAILGFSQLLELECSDEQDKQNVNEILVAGRHLLGLINDVLEISKIEAGHVEIFLENNCVYEVVNQSFTMLSGIAAEKNIKLINQLEEKKDICVLADPYKLTQVFVNLISNAIKYNKENGEVKVNVEIIEDGKVKINFTDTGYGLSEQQQLNLFTPFERLGAENSSIEGSGIGLVISHKLIGLMGGRIGIDSEIGKGSTFWIILPSSETHTLTETKNDVSGANSELLSEQMNSTIKSSKNILYIEDDPANMRLVESIIKKYTTYSFLSAVNGNDGIDVAVKQQPDLILLDINLPDLNGFEVLQKLRSHRELINTPVVAVSANVMQHDVDKSLASDFFDYVTKPIDVSLLLNIINKIFVKD